MVQFALPSVQNCGIGLARLDSNHIVASVTEPMDARERSILVEQKATHAAGERTGKMTSSWSTSAA